MNQTPDRLTELLRELAGAQALDRLVREVIESLTPEQRTKLADTFMGRALEILSKEHDSWQARDWVHRMVFDVGESNPSKEALARAHTYVVKLVEAQIPGLADAVKEKIQRLIGATADRLRNVVAEAAAQAIRKASLL